MRDRLLHVSEKEKNNKYYFKINVNDKKALEYKMKIIFLKSRYESMPLLGIIT